MTRTVQTLLFIMGDMVLVSIGYQVYRHVYELESEVPVKVCAL